MAHQNWMRLGLDPDRFWRLTPKETEAEIDAVLWRMRQDNRQTHNTTAWLAWHVAVLGRVDHKKFPKLDALLVKAETERRVPSWEESHAEAMAWAARSR